MKTILILPAILLLFGNCVASVVAAVAPPVSRPIIRIIVTGQPMAINGVDTIPVGMFGVHATPLTPAKIADWGIEMVRVIEQNPSTRPIVIGPADHPQWHGVQQIIECFYDRYQPALVLSDPDWKKHLIDLGTGYGQSARALGITPTVEFWNEPYLNWATRPAVNYDGDYYDIAHAAEGQPVRFAGSGKPTEHLVWHKGLMAVDDATGRKNILAWGYAPPGAIAGQTYDFRGKRMRMVEHWMARDVTQKSYYSADQNCIYYRQMMNPLVRAIKAADPDVHIIVGWDCHLFQGNWDVWHRLYQPLLEDAHDYIDGLNEHHYGTDPRAVAVEYEVASAYALGTYGRHLKFYNTEAGGWLDPQRPETHKPMPRDALATPLDTARGAMTYTLRDITYLLAHCPDKAMSRAAEEADNGGDEFAFKLLKPLRGRLMYSRCEFSDEHLAANQPLDLWAIASVSGATMCVVVFNDSSVPRPIELQITAPIKTTFTACETANVAIAPKNQSHLLELQNAAVDQTGAGADIQTTLPGRTARRWIFTLSQSGSLGPPVTLSQYVSADVLRDVAREKPVEISVVIPPEDLAHAQSAMLRVAALSLPAGARCSINRAPAIEMAASDESGIIELPIDFKTLKPQNRLTFSTTGKDYSLDAASIVLLTPR